MWFSHQDSGLVNGVYKQKSRSSNIQLILFAVSSTRSKEETLHIQAFEFAGPLGSWSGPLAHGVADVGTVVPNRDNIATVPSGYDGPLGDLKCEKIAS